MRALALAEVGGVSGGMIDGGFTRDGFLLLAAGNESSSWLGDFANSLGVGAGLGSAAYTASAIEAGWTYSAISTAAGVGAGVGAAIGAAAFVGYTIGGYLYSNVNTTGGPNYDTYSDPYIPDLPPQYP